MMVPILLVKVLDKLLFPGAPRFLRQTCSPLHIFSDVLESREG